MNDWVSLGLGSLGGALVSELLKLAIEEAKKAKDFKPLSNDLVSTMTRLLPITEKIDSMQNELDLGVEELKELRDTIERALVLVLKFPSVRWYEKSHYTRRIEEINKHLLSFCQIDLQLLQHRNQLKLLGLTGNLVEKVEGLCKRMEGLNVPPPPVFKPTLCAVPKLDKFLVGLDWPLMELKIKLLDKAVVNLVVSAPAGYGKTTLVNQICHDAQIKGKFKHIFFNVVSGTPNFKVIVQNLLRHNGYTPRTFENDAQAIVGLRNLMEKLKEDGHILLVLDDVWIEAESLLHKFQLNLPGYKILVTSRFDFPGFGSTYHLKPLGFEDARALLIHWASRPVGVSTDDEYEDLLKKILKRCNGIPIAIEIVGVSLKGRSLNTWKSQVESWSEGETIHYKPYPTLRKISLPPVSTLEPSNAITYPTALPSSAIIYPNSALQRPVHVRPTIKALKLPSFSSKDRESIRG